MNNYDWTSAFRTLYDRAVQTYQSGQLELASFFTPEESAFLHSIGCTAQEMYDFIEDACKAGEPSYEAALLIAAVRRDYLLVIQKGQHSAKTITVESLPPKDAALDGFTWLPRIIAKARAKLRGELPAEIMFFCGGDRAFLKSLDMHPADFLRYIWAAGQDDQKIVEYIKRKRSTEQ